MAISFPRAFPEDGFKAVGMSFALQPVAELTPLRSGRQISADLGPTLWRGRWTSAPREEAEAGVVRSWYDTLLSEGEFYGYDGWRHYPLAYPSGFGALTVGGFPFTGSGRLTAVAANNVEISLDQLPVGFALAPGDYVAWDYLSGTARALHRISAAGVASGGGTLTIEVRPHVRAGWAVNAPAGFYRPAARMLVLPGTFSEDLTEFGSFSFEAIQTL